MFLAKVWKTSNGKKYEAWVLKKGVWDKQDKRYRQVYLAYVGTTTEISLEKAQEICTKLGLTLGELKSIRRIKIAGLETPSEKRFKTAQTEPTLSELQPSSAMQPGSVTSRRDVESPFVKSSPVPVFSAKETPVKQAPLRPMQPLPDGADLIRKLREQFGLSKSHKGYEELAMRVGVLFANASELRRAESRETALRSEQIRRMEEMLHRTLRR